MNEFMPAYQVPIDAERYDFAWRVFDAETNDMRDPYSIDAIEVYQLQRVGQVSTPVLVDRVEIESSQLWRSDWFRTVSFDANTPDQSETASDLNGADAHVFGSDSAWIENPDGEILPVPISLLRTHIKLTAAANPFSAVASIKLAPADWVDGVQPGAALRWSYWRHGRPSPFVTRHAVGHFSFSVTPREILNTPGEYWLFVYLRETATSVIDRIAFVFYGVGAQRANWRRIQFDPDGSSGERRSWTDIINDRLPYLYTEYADDVDPDGAHARTVEVISRALWDQQTLIDAWPNMHDPKRAPSYSLSLLAQTVGWRLIGSDLNSWRRQVLGAANIWRMKGTEIGLRGAIESAGVRVNAVNYYDQVRSTAFQTDMFIFDQASERTFVGSDGAFNPVFSLSRDPAWTRRLRVGAVETGHPDMSAVRLELRAVDSPTWIDVSSQLTKILRVLPDRDGATWSNRVALDMYELDASGVVRSRAANMPVSAFNEMRLTYPIDSWADRLESAHLTVTRDARAPGELGVDEDAAPSPVGEYARLRERASDGLDDSEFDSPFAFHVAGITGDIDVANDGPCVDRALEFVLAPTAPGYSDTFAWSEAGVRMSGVRVLPRAGSVFIPIVGRWKQITSGMWRMEAPPPCTVVDVDGTTFELSPDQFALIATQADGIAFVAIQRAGEVPVRSGSRVTVAASFVDVRAQTKSWPKWLAETTVVSDGGATFNLHDGFIDEAALTSQAVQQVALPGPLADWNEDAETGAYAFSGESDLVRFGLSGAGFTVDEIASTGDQVLIDGITDLNPQTEFTPGVIQETFDPGELNGHRVFETVRPHSVAGLIWDAHTDAPIAAFVINHSTATTFDSTRSFVRPFGVPLATSGSIDDGYKISVARSRVVVGGREVQVQAATLAETNPHADSPCLAIVQVDYDTGVASLKYGAENDLTAYPAPDDNCFVIAYAYTPANPATIPTGGFDLVCRLGLSYRAGETPIEFHFESPVDLTAYEFGFKLNAAIETQYAAGDPDLIAKRLVDGVTDLSESVVVRYSAVLAPVASGDAAETHTLENPGLVDCWSVDVTPLVGSPYSVPPLGDGSPLRWIRDVDADGAVRYSVRWIESSEWPLPAQGDVIKFVYPRRHAFWLRVSWHDERLRLPDGSLAPGLYDSFLTRERWDTWARVETLGGRTWLSVDVDAAVQRAIAAGETTPAFASGLYAARYVTLRPVYRYDSIVVMFESGVDSSVADEWGARAPKSAPGYSPLFDARHELRVFDKSSSAVVDQLVWNSAFVRKFELNSSGGLRSIELSWPFIAVGDVVRLNWASAASDDYAALLDAVLRGRAPRVLPNFELASDDWVQAYVMTLPLADTRDVRDLHTYAEWRRQRSEGIESPLSNPCPQIDLNTRLMPRGDAVTPRVCPAGAWPDAPTYGYKRTEVPYGTAVYGLEQYDGSVTPSQDPRDMDVSFVEPCACSPASHFGLDLTLPLGLKIDEDALMNMIYDVKPLQAQLRFLTIRRQPRAFAMAVTKLEMRVSIEAIAQATALHVRALSDLRTLPYERPGSGGDTRVERSSVTAYDASATVTNAANATYAIFDVPPPLDVHDVLRAPRSAGTNDDVVAFVQIGGSRYLYRKLAVEDAPSGFVAWRADVEFSNAPEYVAASGGDFSPIDVEALTLAYWKGIVGLVQDNAPIESEFVDMSFVGVSLAALSLAPGSIVESYETGRAVRRAEFVRAIGNDTIRVRPLGVSAQAFVASNPNTVRAVCFLSPTSGRAQRVISVAPGRWAHDWRVPSAAQVAASGAPADVDPRCFLVVDARASAPANWRDWCSFSMAPAYEYSVDAAAFGGAGYVEVGDTLHEVVEHSPPLSGGISYTEPHAQPTARVIGVDDAAGRVVLECPAGARVSATGAFPSAMVFARPFWNSIEGAKLLPMALHVTLTIAGAPALSGGHDVILLRNAARTGTSTLEMTSYDADTGIMQAKVLEAIPGFWDDGLAGLEIDFVTGTPRAYPNWSPDFEADPPSLVREAYSRALRNLTTSASGHADPQDVSGRAAVAESGIALNITVFDADGKRLDKIQLGRLGG